MPKKATIPTPEQRHALRSQVMTPVYEWMASNDLTQMDLFELLQELWNEDGRPGIKYRGFLRWFQGGTISNIDNWNQPPIEYLVDIYRVSLHDSVGSPLDFGRIFTGHDSDRDAGKLEDLREKVIEMREENRELKQRLVLIRYYLERDHIDAARNAALGIRTPTANG